MPASVVSRVRPSRCPAPASPAITSARRATRRMRAQRGSSGSGRPHGSVRGMRSFASARRAAARRPRGRARRRRAPRAGSGSPSAGPCARLACAAGRGNRLCLARPPGLWGRMGRADRTAFAFSPLRDATPADILAWARRAEALGYEAVFIPESFNDSLAYAEAVALSTTRLKVGTAITNVYLRHPTLLAEQAAAVQEFSGGRLLLGVGVGHRTVNASLGIEMGSPLEKMRTTLATLREAWTRGPHQP